MSGPEVEEVEVVRRRSRRSSATARRTRRTTRPSPAARRTPTAASGPRTGRTPPPGRRRCARRTHLRRRTRAALIGVAWRSTGPGLRVHGEVGVDHLHVLRRAGGAVRVRRQAAAARRLGARRPERQADAVEARERRRERPRAALLLDHRVLRVRRVPSRRSRCSLSRVSSVVTSGACTTGRSATAVETPWNSPVPTCGPSVACRGGGARSRTLARLLRARPSRVRRRRCGRRSLRAPLLAVRREHRRGGAEQGEHEHAPSQSASSRVPSLVRDRNREAFPRCERTRIPIERSVSTRRRRGRAPTAARSSRPRRAAPPSRSGAISSGPELEHRPDERAHHVAEEAVGGDLEVEVVAAADPLGALDGAHEDLVPGLRRRERAEVVLAEEQRGGSAAAAPRRAGARPTSCGGARTATAVRRLKMR